MKFRDHVATTGTAVKRWLVAQSYDALAVGALWLAGLLLLRVPGAPLWAILAAALQFIPNFGGLIALIGPSAAAALAGGFERLLYVLILYAVIVTVDGFVLQPLFLKRTARVPIWASILAPLILGLLFSFWGVLLAAPLLAVIYAYRERSRGRNRPSA
jgi:predicted PurR-regulated permease PerM